MKVNDEQTYLVIKKVIDEWDPVGLLEIGAPDDEYEPEIRRLVNKIKENDSTKELGKHIYDIFLKMFGDDMNIKSKNIYECENVANLILIELKSINK